MIGTTATAINSTTALKMSSGYAAAATWKWTVAWRRWLRERRRRDLPGGHGHKPGCWTRQCDHRADRAWGRLHRWRPRGASPAGNDPAGAWTWYSEGACDPTGGGSTTAMGTQVHFGEVANSVLPLGSRIWVQPAIKGRHEFTVEDRFGSQQAEGRLDVWVACGEGESVPTAGSFRVIG